MNELQLAFRFNKKRLFETVLASIGIVIGISSFVGSASLLTSYNNELAVIREQPAALIIRISPRRLQMARNTAVEPIEESALLPRFQFSYDDIQAAQREIPYITETFQFSRRMFQVGEQQTQPFPGFEMMPPPEEVAGSSSRAQPTNNTDVPLVTRISGYEVTESFFSVYKLSVVKGLLFDSNDAELKNPVAVVGYQLAQKLFADGTALGKKIKLNGISYTIIGIIKDPYAIQGVNTDFNTSLFIPEINSQNMAFQNFRTINFKIDSSLHMNQTEKLLLELFEKKYGKDTITISGDYRRVTAEVEKKQSILILVIVLSSLCILASIINIVNIINNRMIRRFKTYAIIRTVGANFEKMLLLSLLEIFYIVFIGSIGSLLISPFFFILLRNIMQTSNSIQFALTLNWLSLLGITVAISTGILFIVSLTVIKLKNISIVSILRSE